MEISEESIAAYQTILTNPAEHGFTFKPLDECFEPADEATPKHILFQQYVDYINAPLPKFFFYIIMDRKHQQAKAPSGDLGYKLKLAI
jgi:hypothetical protein